MDYVVVDKNTYSQHTLANSNSGNQKLESLKQFSLTWRHNLTGPDTILHTNPSKSNQSQSRNGLHKFGNLKKLESLKTTLTHMDHHWKTNEKSSQKCSFYM